MSIIAKDGNTFEFLDGNGFAWITETVADFATAPTGTSLLAPLQVAAVTADHEEADFPVSFTQDPKRPFKKYHSTDSTETIIELVFYENIDTLFLVNINFEDFTITVDGVDQVCTAFENTNTGRYNGVCFFATTGVNPVQITITAQTPLDGADFFSAGAFVGAVRETMSPRYNSAKQVNEPVNVIQFKQNNKEVNNTGRKYHIFNLDFNIIESADLATLKELEFATGRENVIIVYEKYSDREVGIIAERIDAFPYVEKSVGWHDNVIALREKV